MQVDQYGHGEGKGASKSLTGLTVTVEGLRELVVRRQK